MPEIAKAAEPAAREKITGFCFLIIPYVKARLVPPKPEKEIKLIN